MYNPKRLGQIVAFLQDAEALKDTLRSGWTGQGRAESTAEHTWRLCLLVMLFERELDGIDHLKLLKMCLVHDLGEAISGDVPAVEQREEDGRAERERRDLQALCASLPEDLSSEISGLWEEYTRGSSAEAILAKGFDKLETVFQHVRGKNPEDFDYEFNLGYGRDRTDKHPLLQALRVMADDMTQDCAARQKTESSS